MAKEIKAITCPQCGSAQKTETKPDHYRCNSCQAEYFLDHDHLTVYHNYTYQAPPAPPVPPRISFALAGAIAAAVVIVLVGMAASGWLSAPSQPQNTDARALLAKDTGYSTGSKVLVPFADNAGQPMLLVVTNRYYRADNQQDGVYATFYDPIKQQEIKDQKLTVVGRETRFPKIEARTFSTGALYITVAKASIYQVDKAALSVTDVGSQLFQGPPALQSGVATMEFVSSTDGDGLSLFTNDGKNLFFYPVVNQVYTAEEINRVDSGFDTLLPGATDKTYFAFTDPSHNCPEEKIKLLEIKYKDNGGGPKDVAETVWCHTNNLGYDPATGRDKLETVLLDDAAKASGRITSFRDFTPGRLYFKPKVLYSDAQRLLITFRANASPQAPLSLQCLDPATGRILWTTPLGAQDELERVSPCKSGFLAATLSGALVVSDNGKITSQFQLNQKS